MLARLVVHGLEGNPEILLDCETEFQCVDGVKAKAFDFTEKRRFIL